MTVSQTTVTVELPNVAIEQLQGLAQKQRRSVRDIVKDLIMRALPELPEDVKGELETFKHLSDDVLWLLARSTLSEEEQRDLAWLNDEAQRKPLIGSQVQRQRALLDKYDRVLVRRAEAARVLKARGYDLSDLAVLQTA
jgi:hypothetical protein